MPVDFTLPPDTRAVGTGNPPLDMDGVVDALTASGAGLNAANAAFAGGAKGDGVTDDTAALTAWINAINATGGGASAFLPGGQYMCAASLPTITAAAVTITGTGYAQTANTKGSVISASAVFSPLMTLTGEGCTLRNLTVDGAGRSATVLVINGPQATLAFMQVRACSSGGIACDIQAGGSTAYLNTCILNGVNGANTSLQVNDTDLIMIGCKPKNGANNVVLLNGAAGAQIVGNHMTPGGGSGQNCIWINGNPGRVQITGNRFDNFVRAAVQLSPAGNSNALVITGNDFYSTVQADATWPYIGYDTSAAGFRGLVVVGNTGYATGTNRPLNFLAAITQAGAAATNPTRVSTLGSTVNGNSAYVSGAFYGTSAAPLSSSGNIVSLDGLTYTAVP